MYFKVYLTNKPTKNNKMKDSQNKRLLSHLLQGNKVTPLTAWSMLGIYRLSARIFDLRDQGFDVKTDRIEVENGHGEKFNVAEYSINQ
jgi:hypothetical protein